MSKLTTQIIILVTLVVGWTIFMLYQRHQHKKRMRQIDKEWEERRRRWAEQVPFDSQVPTEWVRRSAMMPNEGYMPSAMFKTDKLSPQKKMGKHMMR